MEAGTVSFFARNGLLLLLWLFNPAVAVKLRPLLVSGPSCSLRVMVLSVLDAMVDTGWGKRGRGGGHLWDVLDPVPVVGR